MKTQNNLGANYVINPWMLGKSCYFTCFTRKYIKLTYCAQLLSCYKDHFTSRTTLLAHSHSTIGFIISYCSFRLFLLLDITGTIATCYPELHSFIVSLSATHYLKCFGEKIPLSHFASHYTLRYFIINPDKCKWKN